LLDLRLEKKVYLKGESIYAVAVVRNVGDRRAVIHPFSLSYTYLQFTVRDDKGVIDTGRVHHSYAGQESIPVTLDPHDSVYVQMNLTLTHGRSDLKYRYLQSKCFISPGTYSAWATFETGMGSISSEIVSFIVEEPQGPERDAFLLFCKAEDEGTLSFYPLGLLDTMLTRYPKSAYVSAAYLSELKIYEYRLHDLRGGLRRAFDFVDRYPADLAAFDVLTFIFTRGNDDPELFKLKVPVVTVLCEKYPDSEIGKRSRKYLHQRLNNK
jgi:hypothetical protein